jgi:ABC-2 type transport system ATP-binding protein
LIQLQNLTKRFGSVTAVDGLDFTVKAGRVTGFLGPNGAGKSTTMRMILGLDRPTAGQALINGKSYLTLRHPLREVGALLDAKALTPGRTGRNHLVAMARSNSISTSRVDEVLETVGLTEVARKRAGTYSLGMGQRLGIAGALIGDPPVLLFDEPVNGLDPDGVRWVRQLMRSLAAEGRTVFVSSHLMSEMQVTADQVVVIGRGKLLADASVTDVIAAGSGRTVTVRLPDAGELTKLRDRLLVRDDVRVRAVDDDGLAIDGIALGEVGDIAHELGVRLHELSATSASLEDVYMELTADSVEFGSTVKGAQQ